MPFDITIIAIVFALILLIIFFSAVVMYLLFRIKETFRKETRRGATIAKIVFLIGTLFLAGGIFYFFANTITNTATPTPIATATPSPSPTPTPTTIVLSLDVGYPSTAKMNTLITMSITITNPNGLTAHEAVIQTNVIFQSFTVQSSNYPITGNVINVGNITPGTTTITLELLSSGRPTVVDDTITLVYQEMADPVTSQITIRVRGS